MAASFDAAASEEAAITAAGLRPKMDICFGCLGPKSAGMVVPALPGGLRQDARGPVKEVVYAGKVHSLMNASPRSCLFRLTTVVAIG